MKPATNTAGVRLSDLTGPQQARLRDICDAGSEGEPTFGAARTRVINTLVSYGLARFGAEEGEGGESYAYITDGREVLRG